AFSVVMELFPSEVSAAADVVLPICSFAEKGGTFVNTDGIHQQIEPAFPPRGGSRPEWRIFSDLLARLGMPSPYFSPVDIRRELDELVERIG
ncbi:MAG: molybdopterin-dependent oxidoreductase, partial [Armatimonadaceae bacterium]